MLRLVRKYTFIEAELDEGLQEYRPPLDRRQKFSDMDAFCDYFEYTWIGNSTRAPVFEKFLWNQYDTVLANLPRSNNMVEGWHNGFQSLVGNTNPTLWTFLSALKKKKP